MKFDGTAVLPFPFVTTLITWSVAGGGTVLLVFVIVQVELAPASSAITPLESQLPPMLSVKVELASSLTV
jgi:hypothetical protein